MRSMINEATLTKRYSTGQYEYEEYTLGAVVDEKESGAEVLAELKKQINDAFVGKVSEEETEATTPPGKTGKKAGKKNGKGKSNSSDDEDANDEDSQEEVSGDDGEGDHDDEAADGEDSDDSDDSSEDGEDSSDDGEEDSSEDEDSDDDSGKGSKGKAGKSGKPADKKEAGGKKKLVKKPQAYNRGIEEHKNIFSGVLRSVSPDWKKSDATKQKAKKTSEALEGEPFLDENGEVVASFKSEVKKLMSAAKKK